MRLLVSSYLWPHRRHAINAVRVVIYEMISGLADQPGVEVSFLKLNSHDEPLPTLDEKDGAARLQRRGVEILPPFGLPSLPPIRSKWKRYLAPRLVDFYPKVAHRDLAIAAVEEHKPDVLLVSWDEQATILFADARVVKFAYYGNPDAKTRRAQARFARAHGASLGRYLIQKYLIRHIERLHFAEMAKYELHGNIAANDAKYYRDCGHPNAFYIQNVWIDRFGESWREKRRSLEKSAPCVIIANVGKLGATANTYGLEYLGLHVLPELRHAMEGRPYEVHILGAGELHPAVAALLAKPEIVIRGFVPDVDEALLSAQVFLCVNNATAFNVCHTRYLHAWSLGCCVVAHANAVTAMPEIEHRKNALLGRNGAEIAAAVAEAAADADLRRRLGEGGYRTFKERFSADHVASEMIRRIKKYLAEFEARPRG